MIFDVFFSICQTEVDDYTPSEKQMLLNFFDQVKHADQLGYQTAWVAETHLSCQIQKENPGAVIPHFKGEIGLNTDILQLAHKVFAQTKNINVGSAIRNILCNGGPIAHAEAIKTFLTLHDLKTDESRLLEIGFASGRFQFSNTPYGIKPRNELEKTAWNVVKGKIFHEATEIFLRLLKGEIFSSSDVTPKYISKSDFRTEEDWQKLIKLIGEEREKIEIAPFWIFDKIGVIPFDAPLKYLRLTIGSHESFAQEWANKFYPCGVFNLSITPANEIEETHQRMKGVYNNQGGEWNRSLMPRTVLVFINSDKNLTEDQQRSIARDNAQKAISNYWKALEGTLDQKKVDNAVDNALVGTSDDIIKQIKKRFNQDDRLMLWFDFNNHDNEYVKNSMSWFINEVKPSI